MVHGRTQIFLYVHWNSLSLENIIFQVKSISVLRHKKVGGVIYCLWKKSSWKSSHITISLLSTHYLRVPAITMDVNVTNLTINNKLICFNVIKRGWKKNTKTIAQADQVIFILTFKNKHFCVICGFQFSWRGMLISNLLPKFWSVASPFPV
jgi:hypothetical protein